ncbi:MAG: hypothetical protein JWM43_24 [Acidobacteriaceae bacterium]|nr:hypothetical protein [Acidobacteriaceae bacterium]
MEPTTIDAIDELVARSNNHPELLKFHAYHRANPQVLDFLVSEIHLLAERNSFSFASLWHYCRWKLSLVTGPTTTYSMNDHLTPLYGRAILILHPEFNGRAEIRQAAGGLCIADEIFGTRPAVAKLPGDYSRRLEWADGTSLENGWRPSQPHVVTRPMNRKADIHPR